MRAMGCADITDNFYPKKTHRSATGRVWLKLCRAPYLIGRVGVWGRVGGWGAVRLNSPHRNAFAELPQGQLHLSCEILRIYRPNY